jgi:dienelactone hydrolase
VKLRFFSILLGLSQSLHPTIHAESVPDRMALFTIPAMKSDSVEVLSKETRTENGISVILEKLYITGPDFNGHPTRIYAVYAYPGDGKKHPAVLELHGSGLTELKPDVPLFYAAKGYACLVIDWAGPRWEGAADKTRPEPRSDFTVPDHYGGRAFSPTQSPDKDGRWKAVSPEQSAITNGVRFARRSLQFLRGRGEVDPDRICLGGASAGAHLALLVLATEPSVAAAVVRYGSAYVRELNWGGYYAQLRASQANGTAAWLAVLDPKHGLADIRTPTLLMSGTDDRFFFMPAVLATWRDLAKPSNRLLIFPNDNHSKVGDREITSQWFQHVLNDRPSWPSPEDIRIEEKGDHLQVSVAVEGDIKEVTFWSKSFQNGAFFMPGSEKGAVDPWVAAPSQKAEGRWQADLPLPDKGMFRVVYAIAENTEGIKGSSDTAEFPLAARWRDTTTPSQ